MAAERNQDIRPFIAILVCLIEGYYRVVHGQWLLWPAILAALPLAWFTLVPRAMRPFANGLMQIVGRVGRVNNLLVLSMLFYLVIAPVGFLVRRLKGSRLELHAPESRESYWKPREDRGRDIDFTKMY